MASLVAHSWQDVAYLGLLVILAIFNGLHNRRIARKADAVHAEVVDVKRATGTVKRATDITCSDDPPPKDVAHIVEPPPSPVKRRRHTDKAGPA